MNNSSFLESLHSGRRLVSDGATGTNLIARGLPHGTTAEHWVLEQPDQIIRLHQEFIAAGADLILTSTFGATSLRLAGSSLAGRAGGGQPTRGRSWHARRSAPAPSGWPAHSGRWAGCSSPTARWKRMP